MRIVIAIAMMGLLSACVTQPPGKVYSRFDVQAPWTVQQATVVEVNEAAIEGAGTELGALGGGYLGASLGATAGDGTGQLVAAAVAGVAGAIIGYQAEKALTATKAWEIMVQVDEDPDSTRLMIVQPADQVFVTGETVRLYKRADGAARVSKL